MNKRKTEVALTKQIKDAAAFRYFRDCPPEVDEAGGRWAGPRKMRGICRRVGDFVNDIGPAITLELVTRHGRTHTVIAGLMGIRGRPNVDRLVGRHVQISVFRDNGYWFADPAKQLVSTRILTSETGLFGLGPAASKPNPVAKPARRSASVKRTS